MHSNNAFFKRIRTDYIKQILKQLQQQCEI